MNSLSLLLSPSEIKLEDLKLRYKDLMTYPWLYSKKERTTILTKIKRYEKQGKWYPEEQSLIELAASEWQ